MAVLGAGNRDRHFCGLGGLFQLIAVIITNNAYFTNDSTTNAYYTDDALQNRYYTQHS